MKTVHHRIVCVPKHHEMAVDEIAVDKMATDIVR